MTDGHNRLRLVRAGIDTYQHPIIYMHRDCAVCRAEGFMALARVRVRCGEREIIATLNVVSGDFVGTQTAALSEVAWNSLRPAPDAFAIVTHADPPASAAALRKKVFGQRLGQAEFLGLMQDAVASRLSDIELAAFVTACSGDRLDQEETIALTRAMVDVGQRIDWGAGLVLDKHGVGGLPGNRTTPIVVATVAAAGYRIPKTSSRAITSPAGTADTMQVMTPVALTLEQMRRVVEREGGCIAWGGSVRLSPADDVLIRIERPLDFDSEGQLVASVLSKKIAAGATQVLIDMPVGATAKVRSDEAAASLAARFERTADALGLGVSVMRTDGRQPVGFGIGPALEARDVLKVLRGDADAPADLRDRALDLAGALIDLVPGNIAGHGRIRAAALLRDGSALHKFLAICDAQGGFTEPPTAPHRHAVCAERGGVLLAIDNRRLARIAKLAGAPGAVVAGIDCRVRVGDRIAKGDLLLTVHANSPGELEYALAYAASQPDVFVFGDAP